MRNGFGMKFTTLEGDLSEGEEASFVGTTDDLHPLCYVTDRLHQCFRLPDEEKGV